MLHLLGKSPQLWTTGGLLTLLLLVPTLLVKAQVAPSLARGRRVRLHLTAPQTALLRGVLVSADADSVRVLSDQGRDTLALPTARLAQVDLSVGQRTQAGRAPCWGRALGRASAWLWASPRRRTAARGSAPKPGQRILVS